ncbi:hypothetical protein MUCCIDRAFT_156160 [Mucor lusitanicus CBS 277.49]|uniref:Uncharacterized protein n=2 Tax=Mucor circinelloides f. lusitanicus TaxID=29924 RepID=A0A168LGC1_MUCCL|nr:hypothetical protein MUCCIDRAFT_156160 [Mucor lusitanicus CBS 277.49]
MLTKQSINQFIDSSGNNALDTLIAFAHFLMSGQQSIISNDPWEDLTITKLYLIAMEMVKNDRNEENDKVEALGTICQTI